MSHITTNIGRVNKVYRNKEVGLAKNFPCCLEVKELCGDLGFNKRKL